MGCALTLSAAGCEPPRVLDEPAPPAEASASGVLAPHVQPNTARPGSFQLTALEHEVAAGSQSAVHFEVLPGEGLKINPQYPWKFTLDEPKSSSLSVLGEGTLRRDAFELSATKARVPLTVIAKERGEYELSGSLNLSVCQEGDEARCLWFTDEPVVLAIRAKP